MFSIFKRSPEPATPTASTPVAAPQERAGFTPEFSSDWFSHNTPAWTKFFHLIGWNPESPDNLGIEIGSYEGRSALWLLENQFRHPASKLICVDVFADADQSDGYYCKFKHNIMDQPHGLRVEVYKGYSFDFLSKFVTDGKRCDFVYVDGSHRAADVLEDLILGFRALKPGGLLICDDYMGGAGSNANLTLGSPKIAVDAFTNIYRDRIEIFGWQPINQCAFTKKGERDDDDPASRGR
ncbi:class I SAM-dependent methyltransferase [Variovorax sp. Sphag1AA]|uniref:class I SAM-dependent methyltransferase n=1 Tax=Variovorax sp. Sphag1AA TaxID=2587027 RepID=UPI001617B187|nr:class I SAM-dependent methyltransferase [Variovorax sp. Sphag1AA]MBB3179827.1 putative O-methyltransferase YrrM [Variovorax sp. Sphag1AA]